jgi:hypothetical protein
MNYYKNPTCFDTEVPSSGGRSVQTDVDPTHLSSCYVAFPEVIKILNIKILKYIKLITINLQFCNINSIKVLKVSLFRYCSCLQLYGSCIQTSVSIACRDLVLAERTQRLASSVEMHKMLHTFRSV